MEAITCLVSQGFSQSQHRLGEARRCWGRDVLSALAAQASESCLGGAQPSAQGAGGGHEIRRGFRIWGEALTGILAKIQHAKMMWHIADVQSFALLRTCIYLLTAIFPN